MQTFSSEPFRVGMSDSSRCRHGSVVQMPPPLTNRAPENASAGFGKYTSGYSVHPAAAAFACSGKELMIHTRTDYRRMCI